LDGPGRRVGLGGPRGIEELPVLIEAVEEANPSELSMLLKKLFQTMIVICCDL
jgi:hypothetical protein